MIGTSFDINRGLHWSEHPVARSEGLQEYREKPSPIVLTSADESFRGVHDAVAKAIPSDGSWLQLISRSREAIEIFASPEVLQTLEENRGAWEKEFGVPIVFIADRFLHQNFSRMVGSSEPQYPSERPLSYTQMELFASVAKDITPEHFGATQVDIRGNMLAIYFDYRDIPELCIEKFLWRLKKLPVHTVLIHGQNTDYTASHLEEMVVLSAPRSVSLKDVEVSPEGSVAVTYRKVELKDKMNGDRVFTLEAWKDELARILNGNVSFEELPTSRDFQRLHDTSHRPVREIWSKHSDEQGILRTFSVAADHIRNRIHRESSFGDHEHEFLRNVKISDLTGLRTYSIDSRGTHLREDALSFDHLDDGRRVFGIHNVNGALFAPFGSAECRNRLMSDVLDLRSNYRGGVRPENELNLEAFSTQEPALAFSLLVFMDEDRNILGFQTPISRVQLNGRLKFTAADQHPEFSGMLEAYNNIADQLKTVFPLKQAKGSRDLVRWGGKLFNFVMSEQVRQAGIALPAPCINPKDTRFRRALAMLLNEKGMAYAPEDLRDEARVRELVGEVIEKHGAGIAKGRLFKLMSYRDPKFHSVEPSKFPFIPISDFGLPLASMTAAFRSYPGLLAQQQLMAHLADWPALSPGQLSAEISQHRRFAYRLGDDRMRLQLVALADRYSWLACTVGREISEGIYSCTATRDSLRGVLKSPQRELHPGQQVKGQIEGVDLTHTRLLFSLSDT